MTKAQKLTVFKEETIPSENDGEWHDGNDGVSNESAQSEDDEGMDHKKNSKKTVVWSSKNNNHECTYLFPN
jgi:hypothetical protein